MGDAVSEHIEVEYVFQELTDIPEGERMYSGRVKPYGTAHAVRAVRKVVDGPFAVINADDFYGREAFERIYDFLENAGNGTGNYCMVGYKLGNTLTENGSVSRGICTVDEDGFLTDIKEYTRIVKTDDGAAYTTDGTEYLPISADSVTSMNIWGFTAEFLEELDKAFSRFYREELPKDPEKAECYLPFVVDDMIRAGRARVSVLH